jgi:hypothetical protein
MFVSDNAFVIANHIEQILPNVKSGSLRFFGVWFGRPHDNLHIIQKAEARDNCLVIRFNCAETLSVWNPNNFTINEKVFEIIEASRLLWQWYYYGRPAIPQNLYYEEYAVEGGRVIAKTNVDWYQVKLEPVLSEPAFKIY